MQLKNIYKKINHNLKNKVDTICFKKKHINQFLNTKT